MPTLDGVKYAYTAEGIKAYIKALRKKGRRNTKFTFNITINK